MYELKELKIEVTYRCPLQCVHCSSDAYPNNPCEMSYDLCRSIIDEAHLMGIKTLAISGGEPLIWAGLSEIIKHCTELGIDTAIYTTGNNFEKSRACNDIFSELHDCGLKKAVFSVYATSPEEHEIITRKSGSFARTITTIQICNELGIETEMHFVATAKNYSQLPNICRLGQAIGVSSVSVLRFVPQGRGTAFTEGTLTKKQNIELATEIRKLKTEGYRIRTGSPLNFMFLNDPPTCMAGLDRLIITPDLRVYPCDAFKQIKAEDIVGTSNGSSLVDVPLQQCWINSPYLQRVRDVLKTGPVGRCATCPSMLKCGTGCLAQKFLEKHVLDRSPDPACILY
jgi:radical SAM protein with 4Fe4S-binding SPASM domain